MVRLTADMVGGAAQRTNPAKERELDLRGYRISVIESLGVTRDQFDTFDLSDNEIRRLDGFPHLPRCASLLCFLSVVYSIRICYLQVSIILLIVLSATLFAGSNRSL